MSFLETLFRVPQGRFEDLEGFRAAWRARADLPPIDAAIIGGALADRLGYAFLAGYTSAVRRLVGTPAGTAGAILATEAGGAHPAAIETRLTRGSRGYTLTGEKTWATLAAQADLLLVLAVEGAPVEGRKRLRIVRLAKNSPGVRMQARPPTPFVPEIPHYHVTFDDVAVRDEAILPGDGWSDWIRPFRTVEDTHVAAATAAFLLATARRLGGPPEELARLVARLTALRWFALEDPSAPEIQLGVAGALAGLDASVAALEPAWAAAEPKCAARWRRDAPLLRVADRVRAERLERALERLSRP